MIKNQLAILILDMLANTKETTNTVQFLSYGMLGMQRHVLNGLGMWNVIFLGNFIISFCWALKLTDATTGGVI